MKISRKLIFWTLLVILVVAGGIYYYVKIYQPSNTEAEPTLQTARVRKGDILVVTNGIGSLVPTEQVDLNFRSSGIVKEVYVALGDNVQAGDLLAILDDTSALSQLATAESSLENLLSPAAVLEAQMAIFNAQKNLEEAVERLSTLISPAVWQAELDVETASLLLEDLKAKPAGEVSSSQMADAEEALEMAKTNLETALALYQDEYLPAVFTIAEVDPVTRARVEIVKAPTDTEIALARLNVAIGEQKLREAQVYLAIVQGQNLEDDALAAGRGAALIKLEQAQQAVENARQNLENTRLIAPIDGTVTKLSAVAGQNAGSAALISLASLAQLQVRFFVDEAELGKVSLGKRVQVILDAYPDFSLAGEVVRIEPSLATVDGSPALAAWATLQPEPGLPLLPGMTADVEIYAGEAYGVLQVPIAALRELAPGSFAVFLVQEDGQLRATPVKVGLMDFTNVEILSGLNLGDIVSTGNVETH